MKLGWILTRGLKILYNSNLEITGWVTNAYLKLVLGPETVYKSNCMWFHKFSRTCLIVTCMKRPDWMAWCSSNSPWDLICPRVRRDLLIVTPRAKQRSLDTVAFIYITHVSLFPLLSPDYDRKTQNERPRDHERVSGHVWRWRYEYKWLIWLYQNFAYNLSRALPHKLWVDRLGLTCVLCIQGMWFI